MKILDAQPKLVEQVHKAILAEIASGKLPPGARIIQEHIAQELRVSRQPVQQALILLRNQGVLHDAPGRGLLVALLDPQFVRHMYDVRAVMEGLAFRKAAENFTQSSKSKAKQLLATGRAAVQKGSVSEMIAADMAFHEFIYELADNPLIGPAMEAQWVNTQRIMGSVLLSANKPRDIWKQHEALFNLVAKGDGEHAEQSARQHIQEAADFMIRRLMEQSASA